MAKREVEAGGLSIRVACQTFQVSQSCYRYEGKIGEENDESSIWQLKLTDNHRNWSFGLCLLFLRRSGNWAGTTGGSTGHTGNWN